MSLYPNLHSLIHWILYSFQYGIILLERALFRCIIFNFWKFSPLLIHWSFKEVFTRNFLCVSEKHLSGLGVVNSKDPEKLRLIVCPWSFFKTQASEKLLFVINLFYTLSSEEHYQWKILRNLLLTQHKHHNLQLLDMFSQVIWAHLYQKFPLNFKETISCFGINKWKVLHPHTNSTKLWPILKFHPCLFLKVIKLAMLYLRNMRLKSCKIKPFSYGCFQPYMKMFSRASFLVSVPMRYGIRFISISTHRWKLEFISFVFNLKWARKAPGPSLSMLREFVQLHTLFFQLGILFQRGTKLMQSWKGCLRSTIPLSW